MASYKQDSKKQFVDSKSGDNVWCKINDNTCNSKTDDDVWISRAHDNAQFKSRWSVTDHTKPC